MTQLDITVRGDCGPALLYVHTDGGSSTFVDQKPLDDPRQRALCRALLLHALALLDETEPAPAAAAASGGGR